MARCEQGYLCEVCGDEVEDITGSDLYLRYVIGEIDARVLLSAPERHIRCNPVQAQFIVADEFEPVVVEGPFAKANLEPMDVRRREELVTRGWRRLQEIKQLGISVSEYPLPEVLRKNAPRRNREESEQAVTPNRGASWPEPEETQELLRRAGTGEDEAVDRLMERHRASLVRMVQLRLDRALKARVDASDIVQDVLWEASRRLKNYLENPKIPFHLWLRELAKDHLIDAHRRHRKAQRRSVDREQAAPEYAECSSLDLVSQLRDRELTPAAATLRKELGARFFAALDRLEEQEAEIVLMRHQEQLTNSEVAQALGISPAAAGMRHLRALRRLREILAERPSAG